MQCYIHYDETFMFVTECPVEDLKFFVGFRVRHRTPGESRRTYQPKRWEYNNKDEVNSSIILSDNRFTQVRAWVFARGCPFGSRINKELVSS